MSEPMSTGALGGVAGWKAIGGLTGVAGLGAAAAAVVVMCMTPPRSYREWAVGLISTVIGSIAGGAGVIRYFALQAWVLEMDGLMGLLGIAFACGLPAWALVRSLFTWLERRKARDLGELVGDAFDAVRDVRSTVRRDKE